MTGLVKIEKGMGNLVKIKILPKSIYYLHGKTQNLHKQNDILVPPLQHANQKIVYIYNILYPDELRIFIVLVVDLQLPCRAHSMRLLAP